VKYIIPRMPSIIEGYNYDIFISYRQKNEGERGRLGDEERLRDEETRQCYLGVNSL